jgi:hypothetical protein
VGAAVAAVAVGLAQMASGAQSDIPVLPGQVRIAVYGDSLATQAAPYFRAAVSAHHKTALAYNAYPGTAICDWLHEMSKQAHSFHPRAVVIEFAGNTLTPCTRVRATGQPPAGGDIAARYRADAERVMRIFTSVPVYWIGAPVDREPADAATAAAVRAVYESLPATYPNARYVDAGQAVLDRGAYVQYLPCLPFEACIGPRIEGTPFNAVRSPDGIHFCPQEVPGNGQCPEYSSGAFRFAAGMAGPLITEFDL